MFKTSKSVLWNDNGTLLCNATGHQEHVRITSDGQGGAIMCWQDGRTISQSIYAQRIDSNGNLQWGENGTILCKADDQQLTPEITSDGQGGAIVAWEDRRNSGITNYDIYAQRIDFNGELKWGENGTVICNKSTHQTNPKITSDGQGGAIIAWWDDIEEQVTGVDIIAQRVNSDGKLLWVPNGTVICNATGDQLDFQIISDNIGNFFISWQDQRTDNDIFAQKINLNGVVQWITNGTLICNALNAQNDPKLVSDGMGGSIITWFDARDGYSDVYAQRINSSGSIQWKANGTLLSNETGTQKYNDITSDGQGGAIIAWEDRKDTTDKDICAQKINSAGIIQWGENGTLICGADGDQESVKITSDGVGGAIIAWSDDRISNDIYAQKINFYGVLKWNDNGTVICNATNRQVLPEIICDGAGGAIIAWEDWRTSGSSDIDIYAQRIAEYPSIRINSPANNTVFNATAWQFNVSVSDGPINTMWYRMNGGPIHVFTENGTIDASEWGTFANGTLVTVSFFANDTLGNQASDFVQVYIDKLEPSIRINSPANNTVFNATAWQFNVSVSDGPINTMWYRMNGGPIHVFTENGTIDASEWGTFANGTLVTVSFFANDTLDNTCQEDIIVRKIVFYDEEASTDLPRNQILGFDMIAVLVGLGIISIITLHKNRNNLNEKI